MSPATVTSVWATPLYPLVPAWAVIASTTAAGSGAGGGPAATLVPLVVVRRRAVVRTFGRPGWTTTSPWLSVAWTWFREAPSPTANVAAAAPNAIAATIVADRTGRANGWARPRVTGRGSGSRAVSRAAQLAAAGPRSTPDGERVDGAQPSGPRCRRPGGHGDQGQRPGDHHGVDPRA